MGIADVVDSALMHAAGKSVNLWNDYTGQTKYGLANLLNVIPPFPFAVASVYAYVNGNPLAGGYSALMTFMTGMYTVIGPRRRQKEEAEEMNMLSSEAISPEYLRLMSRRELDRRNYSVYFLIVNAATATGGVFGMGVDWALASFSTQVEFGLSVAEYYVLSVPMQPPGKGKIRAALERLVPRQLKTLPEPQP